MKKLLLTISAFAAATSVAAGELTYVAPEVTMIEEPAMMGGSGAWLIPLIILAVLGLSFIRTGGEDECGQSCDD